MSDPLRILLIDDDEHSFVLIGELMREIDGRSVELEWESEAEVGLQKILAGGYEVYLLDYRLGPDDGIGVLRRARESGCRAPIIMLTGQTDQSVDQKALEAGASDYLSKDVYDVSRLEHAIRYALERQALLSELETERYLLHSLMQSLPDNIYFKDRDSRFIRVSQAMAEWFGLDDPADAVGKTDNDFFAGEHARQARHDELQLMETGEAVLGKEEKETWPDGRSTWVTTNKLPLKNATGEIVGTFGISRDITEQQEALLALRRSERQNRKIVDTALDAFVAMDAEGIIIDWNPQAGKIFGWSRIEALGNMLSELIIPEQLRSAYNAGLRKYLETGEHRVLQRRLELTALHRSGREFPVEMTISPIKEGVGTLFAAFVHDITSRKDAERQLRESKEAAEAANRAKSDFLANMSHEIRTPMNAIIGMTELVLDTELPASQREYLEMVRDSGDSLLSLINDILDFSKIEAGKLQLDSTVFSIREVLGDTLKSLAVRAHREELELACHIDPGVPEALIGDPARMRQIVINLVGNAIKFTQSGEVVVHVEVDEQSDDSALLHFSVTDTGIGIAPEKLKSIFEAFEQADSSTTRRYGGTGLGLTICSRLVRLMNGAIWADSRLGQGSRFHFTARFLVSDVTPEPPRKRIVQGTRVLVVDDNATNRLILDEMLTNWGMDVTCVESAIAALESLRKAKDAELPYSLLLSDVNMPEEDGFDLAEAVRSDDHLAEAVILMLTSGDRPEEVQRARDLGVSSYLRKPVKQSELFDAIVAALHIDGTDEALPADAASDHGGEIRLPALRVLLVEDSIVNQKLAIALLNRWGHAVTVAGNGREAVELNAASDFDLILMDVQMPEMDGLEATRRIRISETNGERHVPILAMTAHAMTGDREQCLDAGMDAYLTKPVRAWQLLEVMAEFVKPEAIGRSVPSETELDLPPEPARYEVRWLTVLKVVMGDRELLRDVADAFLEEARIVIDDIQVALKNGDARMARRAAHTIKSGFRTFGVMDASELAFEFEEFGREERLDSFREHLPELERAIADVSVQLRDFVDSGRIPP